jgi:hypothetical protein
VHLAITLDDTSQLPKTRNFLYASWIDWLIYLYFQQCTTCCPALRAHTVGHHMLICHDTHTPLYQLLPENSINPTKHLLTFCGSSWDGNHITSRSAYRVLIFYPGVVVNTPTACLYTLICPLLKHKTMKSAKYMWCQSPFT